MAIARVVYSAEHIRTRVRELADALGSELDGGRPLFISVLKGSVIFLADLLRHLDLDPDIDFMSISSYAGEGGRTGVVRIVKDLEEPLEGRDVFVVEDIVDTGLTLSYLLRTLETRNPRTLRVCTLVNKTAKRIADVEIAYSGFESEDFLIGYGLDFKGRYRNLPYLMAVSDLAALALRPDALEGVFPGRGG